MNSSPRKNQLLFFSAFLLSAFGYEFLYFVMTVHIYDLTRSALNVGIFTALTFIPKLFSSVIGGIVDKIGKEKSLAISAVLTGVLLFLMANVSDMTVFLVVWFFAAVFFTVIVNARGTLMAEVVSSEQYASGNAVALTLLNGAKLLGPLIGGVIIMTLSIQLLLYVTGVVYLLVALFALAIRVEKPTESTKQTFLANVRKGFQFMLEHKVFGLITSIAFFWRLFLGLQLSLFVIYTKSYHNCTSEQYGGFMTLVGAGSIVGSLLGPFVAARVKPSWLITGGLGLHYASFVLLGFCKDYSLSLVIVFVSFVIFYLTLVTLHSLRDRITPFPIRASAYGTTTAILTPAAIASTLAGGFLTDHLGVAHVLLFAGLAALLSLAVILYVNRSTLKTI